MTGDELEHVEDGATLVAPAQLGAAAERFARNTLRKSAQTRCTYLSVYRRFAEHLESGLPIPTLGPDALTADAVAGYLDALEELGRSKATVRKERAALNPLTRRLQLIGAIDQTTALEILDVEASTQSGQPRTRPALTSRRGGASKIGRPCGFSSCHRRAARPDRSPRATWRSSSASASSASGLRSYARCAAAT